MKCPTRVPSKPSPDFGVLVAGVIVEGHVDQPPGWDVALEAVQKTQKLLVPVTLLHWPTTVPSSTLRAANKVVVPLRI